MPAPSPAAPGTDEPVRLEIVGESAAGETGELPEVAAGETVRVFTGGRVPRGADTILRQERGRREGDRLVVERSVSKGKDLRPVGEELAQGSAMIEPGTRLDERHLAALSMTGHAEVAIHREPSILLLVSGDEVVAPSKPLEPGEIYDANTPFLEGLLRRLGHGSLEVRHVEDRREAVETELDDGLSAFDLVVSSGGVSVGDYDFLPTAAEGLGAEQIFWNVSQKPGRPVFFAVRDQTPFLGLPGNPGAVFVGAHLYLRRLLDRREGVSNARPEMRPGRLAESISRSSKLRWSPCRVEFEQGARVELQPIGGGRAHRMGQMFRADALARIDAGEGTAEAGEVVDWLPVGSYL